MKAKGYYRRIKYPSFTMYECLVCGQEYATANPAFQCCYDKKPVKGYLIIDLAETIREKRKPPTQNNLTASRPHFPAPTKEPDKWGHRYRGFNPYLRLERNYHFACQLVTEYYHRLETRALDMMFGDYEPRPPRTPIQRMAYGYLTAMWDAVKEAASDMVAEALDYQAFENAKKKKAPKNDPLSLENFNPGGKK